MLNIQSERTMTIHIFAIRVVTSVTRILGTEDLGSDLERQLQIASPRNYVQHYPPRLGIGVLRN